jgi:hypothetical protein
VPCRAVPCCCWRPKRREACAPRGHLMRRTHRGRRCPGQACRPIPGPASRPRSPGLPPMQLTKLGVHVVAQVGVVDEGRQLVQDRHHRVEDARHLRCGGRGTGVCVPRWGGVGWGGGGVSPLGQRQRCG